MYRVLMYVFCSVVVRASLDFRRLLEKPHILPTGLFTGKERTPDVPEPGSQTWKNVTHGTKVQSHPLKPVCYENLGCFSMDSTWCSILRPIGVPDDPREIKASVYFYSRENLMLPGYTVLYPKLNLERIPFQPNRSTVFIVHGFASSGLASWVKQMKTAYLRVKDVNVFTVNWENGAQKRNYLQVAANTRVVGREVASLIRKLIREHGAVAKDFHLIGHSLGSHICSYAAKEVRGIGHLTALDPAQPGFEGFNKAVRLDKSDAEFVEVLHTDARPLMPTMGLGMMLPQGHVDFYLNGGFSQPGCIIPKVNIRIKGLVSLGKIPVEAISEIVSCSHARSYEYYTEALDRSKCTFWGQRIRILGSLEVTMNLLTQGFLHLPHLTKCSSRNCVPIGLDSVKSSQRGSFLTLTEKSSPFCIS